MTNYFLPVTPLPGTGSSQIQEFAYKSVHYQNLMRRIADGDSVESAERARPSWP